MSGEIKKIWQVTEWSRYKKWNRCVVKHVFIPAESRKEAKEKYEKMRKYKDTTICADPAGDAYVDDDQAGGE